MSGDGESRVDAIFRRAASGFMSIVWLSHLSPAGSMKRRAPWTAASRGHSRTTFQGWATRSTQLCITMVKPQIVAFPWSQSRRGLAADFSLFCLAGILSFFHEQIQYEYSYTSRKVIGIRRTNSILDC